MEMWLIVKDVITLITPLFIAWCGRAMTITKKDNEKYRKLREEADRMKEEKEEAEKKAQRDEIKKICEKIDAIQEELNNLNIDRISEQLEHVINMTNLNFEYSQSLSGVVVCLGNSIEEADQLATAGKIHEAIVNHQKKEQSIINRLCKIAY